MAEYARYSSMRSQERDTKTINCVLPEHVGRAEIVLTVKCLPRARARERCNYNLPDVRAYQSREYLTFCCVCVPLHIESLGSVTRWRCGAQSYATIVERYQWQFRMMCAFPPLVPVQICDH